MSSFSCPVISIGTIEKHPNADSLSITEAEGCPVIFRTGDFHLSQYAIYIPVEAVVPLSNPAFAFLSNKEGRTHERIKAKKLRGIFSMGLLVPLSILPEGFVLNANGEPTDCAEALGIVKYEEPEKNMKLGGQRTGREPDRTTAPIYDVESFRKYKGFFEPGERVVATEKVHGCNARFVFQDAPEGPRLFVGSRQFFLKETEADVWWKIARKYGLEATLAHNTDMVLFGEVFGQVQDLKYGSTAEDPLKFVAFDVFDKKKGRYLDVDDFQAFCRGIAVPTAPVLYDGPFDLVALEPLAQGKSLLAPDQIREGFVVKPAVERFDRRLGRVMAKLVGEAYLLRKGGTEWQ